MEKKAMSFDIKTSGGATKTIKLQDEEYYYTEDNSKVVIKHAALERIAVENGFIGVSPATIIDHYISNKDFLIVVEAKGKIDDMQYSEIGEITPANLTTDIARAYPYTMARKRAIDRLYIKMMGLAGVVYSDAEIGEEKIAANKPVKPVKPAADVEKKVETVENKKDLQEEKVKENQEESNSAQKDANSTIVAAEGTANESLSEENNAGNFIVNHFGKFKSKPMTVAELVKSEKKTTDWIMATDFSKNARMAELQENVKLYIESIEKAA